MFTLSRLIPRLRFAWLVALCAAIVAVPEFAFTQVSSAVDSLAPTWKDSVQIRWVGRQPSGRPLFIDFYSDTMVIVNDTLVADHRTTRDSIVVVGDTSFAVHYTLALGRMILITESGNVLTMAKQETLARPLRGRWIGTPLRRSDHQIELYMTPGGTAGWRPLPGGAWTWGEWDRFSREITFTWAADTTELIPDSLGEYPDSITWVAMYDPVRSQLLFNETVPESGVTILRRYFRRPRN